VAVVTGASSGIGAATTRRLATDGYVVVAAARRIDALEELAASVAATGGVVVPVATDMGDLGAVDALVEVAAARTGRIDAVINNAGVLPAAQRAEKIDVADWEAVMRLNLTAPWYLACRCKPSMGAGSVVVNITSTAAHFPSTGLLSYTTSKAALTMVTRGLATEWARDGIRVLAVAPGKVATDLVQPILQWADRHQVALNPLGRIGQPDEVAELIAFLVGGRAGYVTGSVVTIDGGELLTSAATPH
jgi:NAD(P)-dependent dehydrogenase (short-subunit alcohol dehydrogenase family)